MTGFPVVTAVRIKSAAVRVDDSSAGANQRNPIANQRSDRRNVIAHPRNWGLIALEGVWVKATWVEIVGSIQAVVLATLAP
jgi:hypothetical protein